MYSETGRHYHTLTHIASMLSLLASLSELDQEDRTRIRLATFFHDAVYDATRKDNEAQSTALWQRFASEAGLANTDTEKQQSSSDTDKDEEKEKENTSQDIVDHVSAMIDATEKHRLPASLQVRPHMLFFKGYLNLNLMIKFLIVE